VVQLLHKTDYPDDFEIPSSLRRLEICVDSGLLPKRFCPNTRDEIFIEGTEPDRECSMHRILVNPETSKKEIALVYPPEYQAWARLADIPQPLFLHRWPDEIGDDTKTNGKINLTLKITFPDNNDIFKMDPVLRLDFQKLRLKAVAPAGVDSVTWFIDDTALLTVGPPFTTEWQMRAGKHRISVTAALDGEQFTRAVMIRILP
jgi:membrane carboxypeptidase/penicillin-binding protein PbpC